MLKTAAKVCAVILVITYFGEQCYSLSIHYEHDVDNNGLEYDKDSFGPETIKYVGKFYEEPLTEIPKQPEDNLLKWLFGEKLYKGDKDIKNNEIEDNPKYDNSENAETAVKSRVIRQAYSGQAPLYPQLPSNSPYNQYQPYYNNNNQNSQWRPPNNSQQGYPSNGVSNFYPSSTQQNSTYGQHPYNPSQGQSPYYNNNPSSQLPGYGPPNSTYNNLGPSRPPYNQHGQVYNNTYPGYQTPGYRPGNNTVHPYNPVSPYSTTTPSNRHPVIYDQTSNRPSYNNHNSSYWSGNSGTNVRPPYNASNGQNPQYFNSYPNNPYGRPNSTFPHTVPNQGPYHNPSNGAQYPTYNNIDAGGRPYGQNSQNFNSYPQGPNQNPYNNSGHYAGGSNYPNTYNQANGYNPSIPNQPSYNSGPGQNNNFRYPPNSRDTAHDPTKVSPEYFSYPH